MSSFLPGLILGFREGLEAFLMITIIMQYLNVIKRTELKKIVLNGSLVGIIASLIIGGILFLIARSIQKTDEIAKIWESGASIIALLLITTFIYWMIKHGSDMVNEVQSQVDRNISKLGLFSVAFVMVTREGAEIAIFSFAGQYVLLSIILGILLALILAILTYRSLIKVNLKFIFNATLIYLILQAGFLLGYAVHEGLSALKALSFISSDNILLTKAFDLSGTILNHKEGLLGVPLYVILGWYSKPEWIQLILHYGYVLSIALVWKKLRSK